MTAKVIEAVSQPYSIEGQTVTITTSAGIGIYPAHGEDADSLMRSADLALYEAKRLGKNAYRIWESSNIPDNQFDKYLEIPHHTA